MGRTLYQWFSDQFLRQPFPPPHPSLKADAKRGIVDHEEAQGGVMSLQILTAMVLISGATTGVVVEMADELQQQGEATASETMLELLSGLSIIFLWADRDMTPTNGEDQSESMAEDIVYLEITARLTSWGQPVDLHNIVLEVTDGERTQLLNFDDRIEDYLNGSYDNLSQAQLRERLKSEAGSATYTASSIFDPEDTFQSGYNGNNVTGGVVSEGDIIKLYVNLSAAGIELGPSQNAELWIVPQAGLTTYERVRTPETFTTRYIKLT